VDCSAARSVSRHDGHDQSTNRFVISKEFFMNDAHDSTLSRLVAGHNSGTLSRRGFVTGAAKVGVSASVAGAIFNAGLHGVGAAAGSGRSALNARFADSGKTLVISFPQSTTQLDPGLAGNSGYGDIIPINENLY
jgi:hypothetical protein